jgi:hypothetical protein
MAAPVARVTSMPSRRSVVACFINMVVVPPPRTKSRGAQARPTCQGRGRGQQVSPCGRGSWRVCFACSSLLSRAGLCDDDGEGSFAFCQVCLRERRARNEEHQHNQESCKHTIPYCKAHWTTTNATKGKREGAGVYGRELSSAR